jgi:hypothetical protein
MAPRESTADVAQRFQVRSDMSHDGLHDETGQRRGDPQDRQVSIFAPRVWKM